MTGSATITSLGTGFAGCYREVRFAGVCTIVHSATILLPNGVNLTTTANDMIAFRCTTAGQWFLVSWSKPTAANVGFVAKTGDTMTGSLTIAQDQNAATGLSISNFTTGASAAARVSFSASGGAPYAYVGVNAPSNSTFPDMAVFGSVVNKNVILFQNAVERMRLNTSGGIDCTGNVGVTGSLTLSGSAAVGGSVTANTNFVSSTGFALLATTGAGSCLLRPNGAGSSTNQMAYDTSGNLSVATNITAGGTITGGAITGTSITVGSGRTISKVTLSNSAPGVLAASELYLQY